MERKIWLLALLALVSCGQPAVRSGADRAAGAGAVCGMDAAGGEPSGGMACVADSTRREAGADASFRRDGVEVLLFHSRRRCPTCVAIERLTREVVDKEFADRLADSSLRLHVVNIDEEEALAARYEVAWSSLLLHGQNRGADTVVNLTRVAFDNARRHPDKFRATLKREIEKLFKP